MKEPLVIYHENCADGFTAAWACWIVHPNWEFFAATHGNPPPDVTGRHVYMLDFSYKADVLIQMALKAKSIAIIDHHKTAQEEIAKLFMDTAASANVNVIFDLEKSGARLAWEFFQAVPPPSLVLYVEDRDLWRFTLPRSRDVSANIFSYPYDFEVWTDMYTDLTRDLTKFADQGSAIERKHQKDVAELVGNFKRRMKIGGTDVWVANLPYTLTSDAGHLMCEGDEPFAASYWDTPEGRTFSLRSRDDGADVAEVAKLYGGGGHPHAAGFRLPHGVQP